MPFGPRIAGLALGLACLATGEPVAADIYKCTQHDGTPLFTNVPEDPRCRLHLKLNKEQSPAAAILEARLARRIPRADRSRFDEHVQAAAREHGVDAALIHAVISAESGYNPLARSSKGARGLMQLIPETAARYGVQNPFDPRQNIDGGTRYLKDLMAMFGNDMRLALAAYNAGEGSVMRYRSVPPFQETLNYVPKVLAYYKRYRATTANGTIIKVVSTAS
jgi:soluble lytic murein transglycosylase-like protein